jgi:HD-GYP domain-containing protein (c-di-GMP phosphodiesterase class II)
MDIDSYQTPEALELLRAGDARAARGVAGRERTTHAIAAAGFMLAATALAVLAPWTRSISWPVLAVVVVAYVSAEVVRFPVGAGWTVPTQLAFVPMLFLLPTPVVPLVAGLSVLAMRLPQYARGHTSLGRTLATLGDSWSAIGPALVLVLAGAQNFSWSDWPIYIAALAAQFGFDLAATISRCWFAERISPRTHLPLLTWIYLVDAALSPLGLMTAAVGVRRPGLVLLVLPATALLALFARERRQRLEHAVTLSDAYRGTALLLGDVLEGDDAYTGSHSRAVLDLSLAVGEALGLANTQRRNVEFAALLHDVGKIRVPKVIINKTGPLNDEEWEVMRRHTIEGEVMVRQVGGVLAEVGGVVRSSHEHYDGGGYPDRLAGAAIPIEARIIAVCDAYSAMTTDRPYRKARPIGVALTELERCSGSQFDPQVVTALRRIIIGSLADLPEVAMRKKPRTRSSAPGPDASSVARRSSP